MTGDGAEAGGSTSPVSGAGSSTSTDGGAVAAAGRAAAAALRRDRRDRDRRERPVGASPTAWASAAAAPEIAARTSASVAPSAFALAAARTTVRSPPAPTAFSTPSRASASAACAASTVASSRTAPGVCPSPPPFFLRRVRRPRPFGKFRSSSRDNELGLRAIRVRAPRTTSIASGVWATAAARIAALRRRSCLREACTSRRALRACAPPLEFTSRPSSRLVSGQRCTAYSSWTSRVMSARSQIHWLAWSRRPMRRSASPPSRSLTPSRRSSRPQPATMSTACWKASGSLPAATSCSALSRSGASVLRSSAVISSRLFSSPDVSNWSIARARRQPAGATRAPASAAHMCCSPQSRNSTAIRHSSRSKTSWRRSSSAQTGTTRRSTRTRRPRPRRTGPTTIAPPR